MSAIIPQCSWAHGTFLFDPVQELIQKEGGNLLCGGCLTCTAQYVLTFKMDNVGHDGSFFGYCQLAAVHSRS